jgi:hypothetical protein
MDGWMNGWMDDDCGYKPKLSHRKHSAVHKTFFNQSQRKKSIKSQSIGKETLFDFDFVPSFDHFLSSRHLSLSGKRPQVMVLRILFIYLFYLFIISIL